ncbi:MAG: carboxypeptidase-like regulatory domain-containing protein [Bryobacteraceae bacterium]
MSSTALLLRLQCAICCFLLGACRTLLAQSGFVTSHNQPIPGAVVIVRQVSQTISTVTDQDGHYALAAVGPGTWAVTVEMFGFETSNRDVDYSAIHGPVNFSLQLKASAFLKRLQQFRAGPNGAPGLRNRNTSDQQFDQQLQSELTSQQQSATPQPTGNGASNESFLISGSLSPGMAQNAQPDSGPDMRFQMGGALNEFEAGNGSSANAPGFGGSSGRGALGSGGFGSRGGFGGAGGMRRNVGGRGQRGAQFGNRRRANRIRGQASFTLANSAVNAKPFSLNGLDIPQASYAQSRFSFIVGGPLSIPKLLKNPSTQFFITYFGTRARNPELFTETVPAQAERQGNFSQAMQSAGATATSVPVMIVNPTTHQPFADNIIPSNLLNPIALGLLRYYPLPNQPGLARREQCAHSMLS